MARERFGRKDRPGQADDSDPVADSPRAHPDPDPISDEAESDRDDEPADVAPETPDDGATEPGAPPVTHRVGGVALRAVTGLAAGSLARLPGIRAAMLPRLARLVCALAGGVLLFTSFPSLNWWWDAVVAAALLAWVLKHPATTAAGGLGYGFLFGLAFYLPLLPWVSTLVGAVPWMVLAMTCALFPALFGLCAVLVRGLPGWPVWFALVWTAQEWLKSIVPFGGFPWGVVAFGQAQGPFLPLAQLGGPALLSIAIVLIGFSATAMELEIVKWWRTGHRVRRGVGGEQEKVDAAPPAVVLPGVCICLVLFASVVVWPQVRHAGAGSGGEPSVTVALVQGNVPRLGLDFNAQRRAVLDNHVRQTLRLAEDVRAGHAPQPQFVIWPEDSSDIDPLANVDAALEISQAATAIGAPILIGTVSELPGTPPENPEYTNTMIVWNPSTGPADRHDKEIVQPFGEYLPMRWLFKHLSGYANRAGNMVPRPGSDVVHIAGVPIGVATCWEVIFDRGPRKAVLNGAQLLAVPSNNATFNKTMSEQQLGFAKVRAVEHDRYVLVAGTTGISAVIAPDGAELVRTDFFQPDYLDIQVRLKTKLTPATRWGPMLRWLLVAAAAAAILAGIRQNGWFARPVRRRSEAPNESPDAGAPSGETPLDEDSPPAQGGEQAPPEDGGDYTPLHEGGRRPSRNFGRHRGAT